MIPLGLRALMSAATPFVKNAKSAVGNFAQANPVATAVAAGAAGIGGMEAVDKMHTSPGEAYTAQRRRFLGNQETHKPHDAYDAYAEDDFMRQAFAMSQNYDQYKKILTAGQRTPENAEELIAGLALNEKEYNAIRNNKRFAKDFVENGRERKVMERFNNENWGEGWEDKVVKDKWREEDAARRQAALMMFAQPEE